MRRFRVLVVLATVAAAFSATGATSAHAADEVHASYSISGNPYDFGHDRFRGVATIGTDSGITIEGDGAANVWLTDNGGTLPVLTGLPTFTSDIVRGIAVVPNATGGYILDAWGGLHPFGIDNNPAPAAVKGNEYRAGQDWARGVAILPDSSGGYVLDGNGAVHPFSIGNGATPPALTGLPHWDWDIARGITLIAGGGFVLDGWGGLHPFALPSMTAPDKPTDAPYWLGWDIARGITTTPYRSPALVADGWGGLHQVTLDGLCPMSTGVVHAGC